MDVDALIQAIEDFKPLVPELYDIIDGYDTIVIIGNGGSNAIASHAASDFTNVLKKNAIANTDATILTCYINDYGMEQAYLRWMIPFLTWNTLVILISSSGNSDNVVNCAEYLSKNGFDFITLSGFDENNRLNSVDGALMNMWVDSDSYGVVECAHGNFLHSIIDI